MKVSTKGRYALRLMVDLGVNGGEDKYISLKDISARQNISIKYLEQIVTPLQDWYAVCVVRRGDIASAEKQISIPQGKSCVRLRAVLLQLPAWKHRKMNVNDIMIVLQ